MKIKYIIRKALNPFLLITSAVLLFVHLAFENSASWYIEIMARDLIIIFLSIFIYRTRRFKHGLLNILYAGFISFIILRCYANLIDNILALIHGIHAHKFILALQSIPLTIISLLSAWAIYKEIDYGNKGKI